MTHDKNQEIAARLNQLQAEFEAGRRRIQELDAERQQISQTMLRISGAIQVLQELQGQEHAGNGRPDEAISQA